MTDIAATWGTGTEATWGTVTASWGESGGESCDPGPIVVTATLTLSLTVTIPRPPQGCATDPG